MTTLKAKLAVIAKVFGNMPVDPEDADYIRFLYTRRNCATVPENGYRELKYLVEIDELETAIRQTLDRIRKRDGEKIFQEAAAYLQDSIKVARQPAGYLQEEIKKIMRQNVRHRPARRRKAQAAHRA